MNSNRTITLQVPKDEKSIIGKYGKYNVPLWCLYNGYDLNIPIENNIDKNPKPTCGITISTIVIINNKWNNTKKITSIDGLKLLIDFFERKKCWNEYKKLSETISKFESFKHYVTVIIPRYYSGWRKEIWKKIINDNKDIINLIQSK